MLHVPLPILNLFLTCSEGKRHLHPCFQLPMKLTHYLPSFLHQFLPLVLATYGCGGGGIQVTGSLADRKPLLGSRCMHGMSRICNFKKIHMCPCIFLKLPCAHSTYLIWVFLIGNFLAADFSLQRGFIQGCVCGGWGVDFEIWDCSSIKI